MLASPPRPRATPRISRTTKVLLWASIAVTTAGSLAALIAYSTLPETIPIHWNAAGDVDGYGPRWSVLVLAAVWIVMVAGLVVAARYPHTFNYPVDITEANAARVYGSGVAMMAWTVACVTLMFGALMLMSFGIDAGAVLGFALVGMLVAVVAGIVATTRAAREGTS
ncbi:DUF1648 domain-containing protein [Demequina sp.]|uniref:DUF1648 domain-containing protein n=1 Tax=Demequina sp. TaxID=2050685 RepID=UPI003A84B37A